MAAIDPARDARGARWEQRLRIPVLAAAWLALPTVFLYFSELHGSVHGLAVVLSWLIWVVFLVEAVVMLSVVRDRRAWIRGHVFSLAILVATFPLLTHVLESLLAARAVTSVQAIRGLQVLYLAKAGKLIKGLLIVRRSGRAPKHPVLATAAGLLIAATLVGIGDRIATGDKKPTPLHGTAELLAELPHWSLALAAGAVAAIVLALVTGRRRRA
ncbi:MAG: hypothetical protein QOJ57_2983 [Thermoleophilaceae bacterium]|nr:hypothetical protein [Thermoleophilaceae bacterium]